MKLNITIELDEIPVDCIQCKFLKSESVNFGRHRSFVCRLTDIGDDECEYTSEQFRMMHIMMEKCPFRGD